MESSRPIRCARCGVGPDRPFDRDGTRWARCPVCGQESRVADIQCEAIAQHIDKATRDKRVTTEAVSSLRRTYRWILYA